MPPAGGGCARRAELLRAVEGVSPRPRRRRGCRRACAARARSGVRTSRVVERRQLRLQEPAGDVVVVVGGEVLRRVVVLGAMPTGEDAVGAVGGEELDGIEVVLGERHRRVAINVLLIHPAPASSSSIAAWTWPFSQASCNGLRHLSSAMFPVNSTASTSAPRAISFLMALVCPCELAWCSGMRPRCRPAPCRRPHRPGP